VLETVKLDRATGIDIFSDRRGEVQASMRDVGCGGPNARTVLCLYGVR